MPLNRTVSVFAIEAEGTPGTAETLAAGDAAFNTYNASIIPVVEIDDRPGQQTMSQLVGIPGGLAADVSFEVDLYSGAAWAGDLLPALGIYNGGSGTSWSPTSTSENWGTVTCGWYVDGVLFRAAGCMGTATLLFQTNKVTRVQCQMRGVWVTPSDTAVIEPTFPLTAASAPAWNGSTLTLGGAAVQPTRVQVDLGNQVELIEDATAAAGYARAWISDRNVVGTMDPLAELLATRNNHTAWLTPTEQALAIAYDDMSLSVPKLQITNLPPGDRGKLLSYDLAWKANRSGTSGDDELVLDLDTTD